MDETVNNSSNSGGVPQKELHRLRYSHAVNGVGQRVMADTLKWLYQGGTSSYKDYLTLTLGLSSTQYKREFDKHLRKKLDDGDPVDSFDITLCYALLRRTCGLSGDESVWSIHSPQSPNLEYDLYSVKQHRNLLAHESLTLTEQQLEDVLTQLETLYCDIYERTGALAGMDQPYIAQLSRNVRQEMMSLRQKIREKLDPSDLPRLQQEIKECNAYLKSEIEKMAKEELLVMYHPLCTIEIVPWLHISEGNTKPNQLYTKIIVKEDVMVTGTQRQSRAGQDVQIKSLLQVRTSDNHLADVLIFTGDGGLGKTTLLKYILEKWMLEDPDMLGLTEYKLLLYTEMRYPHINNLEQLLENLLSQTRQRAGITVEHLKCLILEMPILVILDGYDEKNPASNNLVYEILHIRGNNLRVIISTRPNCTEELNILVPSTKHKSNFILHGIGPLHQADFIEKHVNCLVQDSRRLNVKEEVVKKLSMLRQELGELLNSPLTLTLLVLLGVECPSTVNALMTATELFEEFSNLITSKLIFRLQQKGVIDAEYKCSEFLKFYNEFSLRTFLRREYELRKETVEELENKCRSLVLPSKEVLSSYYTVIRSKERMNIVIKLKPHHLRFQEYAGGQYVVSQILAKGERFNGNIIHQLLTEDIQPGPTEYKLNLYNILLHITGIMATSYGSLLDKYSSQILELVDIGDTTQGSLHISPLLRHITEARNNRSVILAVTARLRVLTHETERSEWIVEENCVGALMDVLSVTVPDVVNIVIQSDPSDVPQLESALALMSQKKIELEIYLMKHIWTKCVSGASDYLMKTCKANIRKSGKVCRLTGFGGCLGTGGVLWLPRTLVYLTVRVSPPALHILDQHLPRFTHLSHLEIQLEDEERCPASSFPMLTFSGDVLRFYICSGITDHLHDVSWAADVAVRVWPKEGRGNSQDAVGFRDINLTSTGAALLLFMLSHYGFKGASYIWIEFSQVMPSDEVDQIQRLSRELLSTHLYT